MNLQPTEEQKLLRDSVAKFCAAEVPMPRVRSLAEEPHGITAELWRKIAEQAWLGVLVPEEHGGLGLGVTELGIVMEEMGRALVPGPYLSCAALAASALSLSESDRMKRRWLEPLAAGEARGTLALLEAGGQLGARHVAAAARKTDGGYRLDGKKFFVPDLTASDFGNGDVPNRDPAAAVDRGGAHRAHRLSRVGHDQFSPEAATSVLEIGCSSASAFAASGVVSVRLEN